MEQTCLVFEMMDMNLYDLLEQREGKPLTLHEIRPVGKQLLVALDALKRFGVLHTDIKPDNIMFVNMQDQPLRLKLIDFGCAMMVSQVELGMEVQPYGYRAPEIALGLPFTEAIDVWGVGCVLAFLYLAQNLFHVYCKYQMMNSMVAVLGQPEDHLLRAGKYSQQFFIEEEAGATSSWRLMTAEEFTVANYMGPEKPDCFINGLTSLYDLIHINPKSDAIEMEDRRAFVSLLGALLHLDGDERISPRQALQQPFISMSHLRQDVNSGDYLTTSKTAMRVNPTEDRVACAASDCGYFETELSGSMDTDSWCSDEAQDSASAPRSSFRVVNTSDADSWCSDEAQDSASAPRSSFRDVNTSHTDSWCSDEAQDSASAPRSSFRDVNTSHTDSWCSDEAQDSTSAPCSLFTNINTSDADSCCSEVEVVSPHICWSCLFNDSSNDISWFCHEAVDVPAAAKASSGRRRKLMKRIRKFFLGLRSCFRSKVED
ncbi:homeodomain-interacting protein kinase 3-like isoform X2 [Paralichthys olivaceus]